MHIAQKFYLLVASVALVVTAIGLYFVYQQEQSKMMYMLEGRGKIIEAQTQVTRAYIAKNYVSKVKGMKGAEGVQISKDHLENPGGHSPAGDRHTRDERGIVENRLVQRTTPQQPTA